MDKQTEFILKMYPYAMKSEQKNKIPHLFKLAQCALESGWGTKGIGNNIFGIKPDKNWKGKTKLDETKEYWDVPDKKYPNVKSVTPLPNGKYEYLVETYFKDYDTIEDCFLDHDLVLLKDRYKEAFKHTKDPKKFGEIVWKSGYATSLNYGEKINRLVDQIAQILKDNKADKVTESLVTGTIDVNGLNIRFLPSTTSDPLYKNGLPKGMIVEILGRDKDWYKIRAKVDGFVMTKFLNISDKEGIVNADKLNFRASASPTADMLTLPLLKGGKVIILDNKGEWSKVQRSLEGWASVKFIKQNN